MKFWKRSLLFLIAFVMVISVIGCTAKDEAKEDIGTPDIGSETPQEGEKELEDSTITITDHLGRTITMEKKAEKIVSGYYITTSMLIALGLEDNVVGVEAKANTKPIYSLAAPQFLELPNVGTAKEFNLEGTIALNPDLVILPIRLKDAVESLEKMGITVIAVNPESMDLLKEAIEMIGKATGTTATADKLIAYYDQKTIDIRLMAQYGSRMRIYLGGNSDFLSTASKKMYQSYMIETAGGTNVAYDIDDTYWSIISYEQLIAYNPEMIVIVPGATYTKEDILNDPKLAAIDAVKNNKIYVMPDSFEAWDSPVPSSILGTRWLGFVINEDLHAFDAFKDEVVEFYETFYGFTPDKEKITK
ncbi:ABC transporter substrate-binding protein [Tissierella sp.]|uniref:ABC transporter substrate-binding protein n=1 Tax=Tissierella sp. TaxID=41274 RepID=UPI002866A459|nr:ABC transporter substrate-binding protein [Tissierella sp.]MDR7855568.1 ABC transporter substrate-binding protein [Tissierella sp.]